MNWQAILLSILIQIVGEAGQSLMVDIMDMVRILANEEGLSKEEKQKKLRSEIKTILPNLSSSVINVISESAVVAAKEKQ